MGSSDRRHGVQVLRALAANVPGVRVARTYERRWLGRDLFAGLALTALLIPEGMAFAELAGLPAVTGLYTTVVALVVYAIFGPSNVLMIGPDSALGPLIAAAVLPLVADRGSARAVALAGMLALLVGALCIAAGVARLGIVSELLSKPVRVGLLDGIALVVVVSQLPKIFGFSTHAHGLPDELAAFVDGVHDGRVVAASVIIGVSSLVLIVAQRRWWPRVPGILLAVIAAVVATRLFDLTRHGVAVVGAVPAGFPMPAIPDVTLHDVGTLGLAAAGMAFLVLADTIGLSRAIAGSRKEPVDANGQLVAVGIANTACGFFQGFPSSASLTRTGVAQAAGSRTQLAGLVGAVATVVVLVADSGLGTSLPQASLAAIVIVAAIVLFDARTLRWLWSVRRSELWLAAITFFGVAVFGVLEGIGIALALSVGDFARRAWRPHDAVLGRVPDRKGYHDLRRHPEAAEVPGLVLYRFDAPIFFANAEYFAGRLTQACRTHHGQVRWVVVAAEPITDVDSTGAESLGRVLDDLEARRVTLAFAELKGPVKDRLRAYGLYDRIGDEHFFPTVGTAVHAYLQATHTEWVDWSDERIDASRPEPQEHRTS